MELGQSLEALGMGSLQLWGNSGVGDVGTAVEGDPPPLRQNGENGAWPPVISRLLRAPTCAPPSLQVLVSPVPGLRAL